MPGSHVPEGRRLFPGLSVRDNLRLGGWRSRNDDMAAVLALFPILRERLGQVAGSLSGGEQQMCHRPGPDEPGLDDYAVSADGARLAYPTGKSLEIKSTGGLDGEAVSVDLDRIRVTV